MDPALLARLAADTARLEAEGLLKRERVITSGQQAVVRLADGREVINLCANNYLGLANHPLVREAAHRAIDRHGYGMASVRFICGTQGVHRELEERLSAFLGTEDTILYSSCFDANGGLFETLTDEQDAIISDALNHASIIDGIRLSKARRLRYPNRDLDGLEDCLRQSQDARARLVVTDGVFSMDGTLARLQEICALSDRYGATLIVDDSHATGFMGVRGRGTHEHCGVMERVDVLTGTLGKALGGASGGYTSGRREIIAWLRQRSRPYLELDRTGGGRDHAARARPARLHAGTAPAGARQRRALPQRARGARLRPRARRASHNSGHAGRRAARRAHG